MSSRRQISIPLGGRYRQVSLYVKIYLNPPAASGQAIRNDNVMTVTV